MRKSISSTDRRYRQATAGPKPGERNINPFDALASEYDAWFDGDGKLVFFIEAQAFRPLLPSLLKPWLEIGVGSGRFSDALGIETGIDPSIKLVEIARKRGINAFLGRGEEKLFDEESFGTI